MIVWNNPYLIWAQLIALACCYQIYSSTVNAISAPNKTKERELPKITGNEVSVKLFGYKKITPVLQVLRSSKVLRELCLSGNSLEPEDIRLLAQIPSLEKLTVGSDTLNDETVRAIAQLKLKSLSIYGRSITDNSLLYIGKMPTLEELMVFYSPQLTDEGFEKLQKLSNLKMVCLRDLKISGKGLSFLLRQKELSSLDVSGCPNMNDSFLPYLSKSSKLSTLDVSLTQVTGQGFKSLAGLKTLAKINLRNCPVTDESIENLRCIENLKELIMGMNFKPTYVTYKGIKKLCGLRHLEKIVVCVKDNPREWLHAFKCFPSFKELNLVNGGLLEGDFTVIASMKSLEKISLDKIKIPENELSDLSALPRLRHLSLYGMDLTNSGLKNLCVKSLEVLAITHSVISNEDLIVLTCLENIEGLAFTKTNITGRGLKYITRCSKLVNLNLNRTPVDDDALKYLLQMSALKSIELSSTHVRGPGLGFLTKLPLLEELDLSGTYLDRSAVKNLIAMRHLKYLSVLRSKLSQEQIAELRRNLIHQNCAIQADDNTYF